MNANSVNLNLISQCIIAILNPLQLQLLLAPPDWNKMTLKIPQQQQQQQLNLFMTTRGA